MPSCRASSTFESPSCWRIQSNFRPSIAACYRDLPTESRCATCTFMVHTAVKSHYLVRQPGPARVSFAQGSGWVALPYYDIRECRLDHSRADATLFLKHNEYTIVLRGRNLRQLYGSLLLEEVVEIPTR